MEDNSIGESKHKITSIFIWIANLKLYVEYENLMLWTRINEKNTHFRYLSAGRKWVPEGIEACGNYVHLVAWGSSALMTIAVLITHKVIIYNMCADGKYN